MILLFVSYVCDYCEGRAKVEYYSGYIVDQPKRRGAGNVFQVFRTRTDAALWRSAAGLQQHQIREVWCEYPICWRQSRGSLTDIQLADRPFEIFENSRFEPGPHRAFVAPAAKAQEAA